MWKACIWVLLFCSALVGCHGSSDNYPETIIPFGQYEKAEYYQFIDRHKDNLRLVVLNVSDDDFLISGIDKIVLSDSCIYVQDWVRRKILVYDETGEPIRYLYKRGRGPGEYLQISDFDVDEDGNLWVLDGQKNVLITYNKYGDWLDTKELPWEVQAIKCRESQILFGLAPWNMSTLRGSRLLVVDHNLSVQSSQLKFGQEFDRNYFLPASVFNVCNDKILLHQPIDDNVYVISGKNTVVAKYLFDFGDKTVPKEIRSDIERNRERLKNYSTLVNSIYIDAKIIAGSLLEECVKDFIVDREAGILYLRQNTTNSYVVGIYNGNVILKVSADDSELFEMFPANMKLKVAQGAEALLILNLH